MYLHIGSREIVEKSKIIGIFDMETVTVSSSAKNFLSTAEKKGEIRYSDEDIPKTFIVCDEGEGKQKIFLSRISSRALNSRTEGFLGFSIQ
jgi:hypothetical protein